MPPDEPAPGPTDEPPIELEDGDLRSVREPVAAPSAPLAAPRPSASTPQLRAAPPGGRVRAPRAATLFGVGVAPHAGPAVDETQRLLAEPPTLQETQRRVTGPMPTLEAPPPPVASPSDRVRFADPDAETLDGAPAVEIGLPAIELPAPAEEDNSVSHPPVAPPKPREALDAIEETAAPKVVVEGRRAVPDELAETQMSARRVQLAADESGPIAARPPPRTAPLVIAILGACLTIGVVAILVVVVRAVRRDDRGAELSPSASTLAPTPVGSAAAHPAAGANGITPVASNSAANSGADAGKSPRPDGAAVPKGFGRLTVETYTAAPPDSAVFIGDKSYGEVGQALVVPCGYRWIFVGRADAKGRLVRKLSKPYSVFTACGAAAPDGHVKLTLR